MKYIAFFLASSVLSFAAFPAHAGAQDHPPKPHG